MEYEFSHDGETYLVRIDSNPAGEHKAVIAGKEYTFSASNVSPHEFSILMEKKNMKAYVAADDDHVFVHIGGSIIKFGKPGSAAGNFAGGGGEFGVKDEISTPMPGKVVKVLVNKGDQVNAGQPLVIVESMKMENEIKSPADGEVISVHYTNGDLVEPGQPIIKLKPAE